MMLAVLLFLISVQNTLAGTKSDAIVREDDQVRKIELQDDGKAYRVAFWGLAAIYTVPKARKDVVRCLRDSVLKSRAVQIDLKAATGEILGCK